MCLAGLLALLGVPAGAAPAWVEGEVRGEERVYPVPPADGVSVDRGAQVILARGNGHVYAFALSCPHQNAAVKWVAQDNTFRCTKHDSRYQLDGVHTAGRATRNLDRYPIRRDGTAVHVDVSRVFQSDKDNAGWNAASVPIA